MKKTVIALLAIVAVPLTLSAGAHCSKCRGTSRAHKNPHYSKSYHYDAAQHENSIDHYVSEDDHRIAKEIRRHLQKGNYENPNDIQVFVEYGKVILEGEVSNSGSRQNLEQAASSIPGVRNVVNGIHVDNRSHNGNGSRNGNGSQNGNGRRMNNHSR